METTLDDDLLSYSSEPDSVFERSRLAIAVFTWFMVALSVTFVAVGSYVGARYLAERPTLTLSAEAETAPQLLPVAPVSPAAPATVEPSTTSTSTPTSQLDGTSTSSASAPSPETTEPTVTSTTALPTTVTSTTVTSTTVAPSTSTSTVTSTSTSTPAPPVDDSPNGRGQRALGAISFPWDQRLPGWTIVFQEGRSGLYGLTLVNDKRIEIYVRDDQPHDLLVHIVAHEIGHAVDVTLNNGPDRRLWQDARGIGGEPWWPDAAASDFRTGAGDFAEGFAYWQTRTGNYRSKLGPAPTDAQLQLMAELAYG